MVEERPLCDSRYGKLCAGKLPFTRDCARFTLRLAGLSLSRLGEGRRTVGRGVFMMPNGWPLSCGRA